MTPLGGNLTNLTVRPASVIFEGYKKHIFTDYGKADLKPATPKHYCPNFTLPRNYVQKCHYMGQRIQDKVHF